MQTFKKALIAAVSLICAVAILSMAIIEPYIQLEGVYYCDAKNRKQLAGTIDYVVIGASHALTGFIPSILDEELGCSSYNLSGIVMTPQSKLYLLEKELKRNPVQTVVLEVSYDNLLRDDAEEHGRGDAVTVSRLDSPFERVKFVVTRLKLEDWANVYSRALTTGLHFFRLVIGGERGHVVDYDQKGHWVRTPLKITLSAKKARRTYNRSTISTDYRPESVEGLSDAVELCRRYGAEVMIVVCPVSNRLIWQNDGWDGFRTWLETFCEERQCPCYDFNLLQTRYDLFSDRSSFYNSTHMSNDGAIQLSTAFVDLMKKVDAGEDVRSYFYDTYADMKADSPYRRYLN